jgi:hypothetical protein
MKNTIFIFCFLLFSCITYKDNTDHYLFAKNNNILINYSIDDSEYVDFGVGAQELTEEQKKELMNFLEMFESTDEYIKNIIHKTTFKYDIKSIYVFPHFNGGYYYGLGTIFYSTKKLAEHSKYDEENEYWYTFNIAEFIIENGKMRFIGWFI